MVALRMMVGRVLLRARPSGGDRATARVEDICCEKIRGCCYRGRGTSYSMFAVGTRVTSRPPHRSLRAQFGHTACMGLSLSRVVHTILSRPCLLILLFDPR